MKQHLHAFSKSVIIRNKSGMSVDMSLTRRIILSCCMLTLVVNCGATSKDLPLQQYKGKFSQIYAPGIINPEQGSIELSIRPTKPAEEFENEWSFALSMVPGQSPIESPNARTLFGIYTTSGEHNNRKLMAIVRNNKSETFHCGVSTPLYLSKGRKVNLALTWGADGTTLHINGKKVAEAAFRGIIDPMSATFNVCSGAPFAVQAMRVSVKQLSESMLNSNPDTSFNIRPDTSFIASNGMNNGQYFITSELKGFSTLMPIWSMIDSFTVVGSQPKLKMISANYSKLPVTNKVKLKVFNVDRQEVVTKDYSFTLAPMTIVTEKTLDIPLPGIGFYHLELTAVPSGGVSSKWNFTHAVIPAEETGVKDGKFAGYLGHHLFNLPEVIAKMNIRWIRSDAFAWFAVEPEKDRFDWKWSDKIVNATVACNIKMLGILGVPPVWAADAEIIPTHPNAYMSGRRKPAKLEEWENYVYQIVSRYKDRVKYWEIWNEADWHPPAPAASYSGSTRDYLELLKSARRAAKKADPEAKILITGFGFGTTCDQKMPFELLRMGAAEYCDIYNVHSYRALSGIDELLAAIKKADPSMPVWQTEQMWHTVADTRRQSVLTAAIVFWFIDRKFDKYFSFGEDFFFSLHTLSPNPVVSTLASIQNLLRKCDRFDGFIVDPRLQYYDLKHQFRRTDGSYLSVIGRIGTPVEMRFSSPINEITDIYGRKIPFSIDKGISSPLLPFEIAFIISPQPLSIISEKTVSANLCANGGFELVSGDLAMIGVEKLEPSGWRFREKTYDSDGNISISTKAHSGKYALSLQSSGKGRVYAFFEQKISQPGLYNLSFQAKASTGRNVPVYVDVYDLSTRAFKRLLPGVVSSGEYRKYQVSFNFDKPSLGNVAFSIGLEHSGAIIIDNVSLEAIPPETIKNAYPLKIDSNSSVKSFSLNKNHVNIDELLKQSTAKSTINSIPFSYSQRPLMLSSAPWTGINGNSAVIPLKNKFSEIVLLLTAMYVPDNAAKIATVKLLHQDGSSNSISLENRKHLRDWFLAIGKGILPVIKYAAPPNFHEYGVFMVRIQNPNQDSIFKAIEINALDSSLLCVIAATIIQ